MSRVLHQAILSLSLSLSPVILPSLHFPLIKQSFDYCRSNFRLFCSRLETPVALTHRFSELINLKHFLSLCRQFWFFKLQVAVCYSSGKGRFPLTFYTSYILNICNRNFCKTSSKLESSRNLAQHTEHWLCEALAVRWCYLFFP